MSSRNLVPLAAAAGVVGPVGFAAQALGHSLARTDHDLAADPISALAAGSTGWAQDAAFAVWGLLLAGFAVGLHRVLRPGRAGALGPALFMLSGAGLVWAGLFPATDPAGAFTEDRVLHTVAAPVVFLGAGIGLIALSRRVAGDPDWRRLAPYVLGSGVAMVVLFVGFGALVRPAGAPLHDWLGLGQWVMLAAWLPVVVTLALRLWHTARQQVGGAARTSTTA